MINTTVHASKADDSVPVQTSIDRTSVSQSVVGGVHVVLLDGLEPAAPEAVLVQDGVQLDGGGGQGLDDAPKPVVRRRRRRRRQRPARRRLGQALPLVQPQPAALLRRHLHLHLRRPHQVRQPFLLVPG